MTEPLTKEELALARGYAESVYADTSDPQKHAAAVMMLRLLDTLAALEAEYARLRPLAEVGEAVEGMPDAAEGGLSLETPHRLRPTWRLWGNHIGYRRTLVAEAETLSALFATIKAEDAALRGAKGES